MAVSPRDDGGSPPPDGCARSRAFSPIRVSVPRPELARLVVAGRRCGASCGGPASRRIGGRSGARVASVARSERGASPGRPACANAVAESTVRRSGWYVKKRRWGGTSGRISPRIWSRTTSSFRRRTSRRFAPHGPGYDELGAGAAMQWLAAWHQLTMSSRPCRSPVARVGCPCPVGPPVVHAAAARFDRARLFSVVRTVVRSGPARSWSVPRRCRQVFVTVARLVSPCTRRGVVVGRVCGGASVVSAAGSGAFSSSWSCSRSASRGARSARGWFRRGGSRPGPRTHLRCFPASRGRRRLRCFAEVPPPAPRSRAGPRHGAPTRRRWSALRRTPLARGGRCRSRPRSRRRCSRCRRC